MNIRYLRYIRGSPKWKAKRLLVLQRDGYRCQLWFDHPGEEVHHRTYEHLYDEPLEDLITLCRQCHEAITDIVRRGRHASQAFKVYDHQRQLPMTEIVRQVIQPLLPNVLRQLPLPQERESRHGVSIPAVQNYRRITPGRA